MAAMMLGAAFSYLPMPMTAVCAEEEQQLTFQLFEDHAAVTKCYKYAVNVEIPAEINGLPVTEIGERAFDSCKYMTGITIPDSVTSIGANAFEFCNDLTIFGYAGSYAEAYAKENEIEFKVIEAEQKSAAAGDINGDGKVNLKDVVILRRYIAGGWNVTLN